jgi:hypothetical protein
MISLCQARRRPHIHRQASARLAINEIFIGPIIGGKGLGGQNVIVRQPGMIDKDGVDRHAGTELAQHGFNRNTRAADDGFAAHDLGVDLDPLVSHLRLVPSECQPTHIILLASLHPPLQGEGRPPEAGGVGCAAVPLN